MEVLTGEEAGSPAWVVERAEYWSGLNPTGSARPRAEGSGGKFLQFSCGEERRGNAKKVWPALLDVCSSQK